MAFLATALGAHALVAVAVPQAQPPKTSPPSTVWETDLPPDASQAPTSSATKSPRKDAPLPPEPNRELPGVILIENAFITQENQLIKTLQTYSPRMEIYLQNEHPDPELGSVPEGDYYFLGRVKFQHNGVMNVRSLLPGPKFDTRLVKNVSEPITQYFSSLQYSPATFYFSLVMDNRRFDRQRYTFELIRQEFLGNVRCLVFDVKPKPPARHSHQRDIGLFEGRIWVEDRDYNVVRFNGTFTPAPAHSVYYHFDSWRENVRPGLWLPAYAYSEESGVKYGLNRTLRFRAQIRFWGYGLDTPDHPSEMTRIDVDPSAEVKDSAGSGGDASPVAGERQWQQQAQDNVLDRLQKAGFLAPPGDVGKVLETVVNNLVVSNHLDNLPSIQCRVLLTSTLESLAVGDSIILSRGLIDVLPDEASLAAMLAHELAHILLQETMSIDATKWAFEDRLMIRDEDLFQHLNFKPSERNEEAADAKALELLKNSPYKEQLAKVGLFLRAMANAAPHTPQLFGAHLGSRLAQGDRVLRLAVLMNGAPQLEKSRVDQIAALPLGGRVKVDPWSDGAELMKAKPVALVSAREKMPFEITPLFPYLTRLPEQAHQ
jgi:hypothetical protein